MTDEQQIAALREEIRRAGGSVAQTRTGLRRFIWGLLGADIATLLVCFAATIYPENLRPYFPLLNPLGGGATVALPLLLLLALVLFPVPSISRRRSRKRLLRHLRRLPRPDVAEVLLPLRRDPEADTRKIVTSLSRSLRLPAEVAPAFSTDVRGEEATPAEPSHESRLDN